MERNAGLSCVNSSRVQARGDDGILARLMAPLRDAHLFAINAHVRSICRGGSIASASASGSRGSRVSVINSPSEDFISLSRRASRTRRVRTNLRELFSATWILSAYETASTHVLHERRATIRRRRDDNARDQGAPLCFYFPFSSSLSRSFLSPLCLARARMKNWLTSRSRHARWPRRCLRRSR